MTPYEKGVLQGLRIGLEAARDASIFPSANAFSTKETIVRAITTQLLQHIKQRSGTQGEINQ